LIFFQPLQMHLSAFVRYCYKLVGCFHSSQTAGPRLSTIKDGV
jgi:hypothetical protein